MSVSWTTSEQRAGLVAQIQEMETDPEVRRRAIQYSARMSLYDAVYALAYQDVQRERAVARAVADKPGDDDPATFADWWDCTASLLRGSMWRYVAAPLLGGLLLAYLVAGAPLVNGALWAALTGVGR